MVAVIRNRGEFLRNYGSVVSDRLRTAILMQDSDRVFENWQGMMVGAGTHNMWLRESGEGEAARYEIVTINDSDDNANEQQAGGALRSGSGSEVPCSTLRPSGCFCPGPARLTERRRVQRTTKDDRAGNGDPGMNSNTQPPD